MTYLKHFAAVLFFLQGICFAQDTELRIASAERELVLLQKKIDSVRISIETLRFQKVREQLGKNGLPELKPGEEVVYHKAYALVYDESHEQAKWVSHIILPEVRNGNEGRSNDFRPDPLVKTGSAVEADYFLRLYGPDSILKYDAFGYDRGHLAPSADFRYSKTALSESYFYSNMAPQVAELNRGRWAELEDFLRQYVIRNNVELFVSTGPLLRPGLGKIPKSINKVSIPEYFYKAVLDLQNKKGIAFLMPNRDCDYPLFQYACSIDSIENLTGINFFAGVDDIVEEKLESGFIANDWLTAKEAGDVLPLRADSLPQNSFNTIQARNYVGKGDVIRVCGTVVGTKLSAKGNIFLNLDKRFPNQIFTITIFNDKVSNFSYQPEKYLTGRRVCVIGRITNYNGSPSVNITDDKSIEILDPVD